MSSPEVAGAPVHVAEPALRGALAGQANVGQGGGSQASPRVACRRLNEELGEWAVAEDPACSRHS